MGRNYRSEYRTRKSGQNCQQSEFVLTCLIIMGSHNHRLAEF